MLFVAHSIALLYNAHSLESTAASQTGRYACRAEACDLFIQVLGAVSQSGCSYILCSRIKRERGRVVYETAEPRLQIAGPDLPARCQLISAFQKRSRGTMDRLTPPYKPGDRLTVNRETGREGRRQKEQQTPRLTARSGFDTYLLMRGFPHRLLGIRST